MKKSLFFIIPLLFLLNILTTYMYSQTAGVYMESMTKEFKDITADMWDYTSAVAHGKSARKVENRRKDVLKTNMDAQKKIQKMSPFENDKTLRDSVIAFLKINYHVINYDYGKIVDMEEIAEQSYDAMEAYLAAQEKANQKLNDASDMVNKQQKIFAENHGINLIDNQSKTSLKLQEAGKVFGYYNKIYLIFFKSYKQEAYMIDALNKINVSGLKQNADALVKCSEEGIQRIDTVKAFKGDNTVKLACKELLVFYKNEATVKAPTIINFLVKKENFDKVKAAFDAKPQSSRTKADIDEYNSMINEYNKASNEYNAVNQELNTKRTALLNKWNDAVLKFMDKQVPKYK